MTSRLFVRAMLTGLITAFGASAFAAEDADTLIYCAEAAPRSFDPSGFGDTATAAAVALPMFDRLVDYEPGTTEIVPSLASSWTVSEDGKTYTFELRRDVRFHDNERFSPTRPMTAADVVFSFQRQLDESHPWYGANEVVPYGPIFDIRDLVETVEALDDHTVVFRLNQPHGSFLSLLAVTAASIVSAEYAAALDDAGDRSDFIAKPIGTGPFRFVHYAPDAATRLTANQDHWRGRPKLENLIVAVVVDQAVRTQKMLAGECHVAPHPNPAEIDQLQATEGIRVMEVPAMNYAYLAFNTQTAPFDRPDVRRALTMAIDRDQMIDIIYDGRAEVAHTPVPPGLWSHNVDVAATPYDPEGARKLLESAAVGPLELKIWAMPVQRAYNPNGRRMAEMIIADLEKVGVQASIISFEWGEYTKRSREIDRDGAVLLGWNADTIDPDNFLSPMFTCPNVAGSNRAQWCSEDYDRLIDAARTETDQERREDFYRQAQALFAEQLPQVPIAYATIVSLVSDKVEGFVMEPTGWHRFHNVTVKP